MPDTPLTPDPAPLPAGLMLVHGNHPEQLRDLLVAWIRQHPLAPLEKEVMLVQSNGIAQWLKLTFAADAAEGGVGICAAFDLSLPSRFVWQAYRAVLGDDAVPAVSPFDKSRLVWRLARIVPALLAAADSGVVFAPLARFASGGDVELKRFQLAERVADLFDQYQVYRADWLAAWAAGDDVLIDARGGRRALPDDQRWQAALWRALLADLRGGHPDNGAPALAGRAAVHEAFMQRAAAWTGSHAPPRLPRRLVVFGISSLPRQALEVLVALARWCQVLVCVHNPCAYYWADIVADQDLLRAAGTRQRRRGGAPAGGAAAGLAHGHPLLAAWGKQGRDFIGLLDEYDSEDARAHYATRFARIGQRIDLFDPSEDAPTLLRQLQDDIRELRSLEETRARWPAVDPARDASIRFHVAHSAQREVEILHDQLLAAFAADPTLRARDVIVMVPDIDAYAPHIEAVFGLHDAADPRHIPFSVADRGPRASDPLAGALETLLALPQSRVAVSDVLDLLEVPAVRARFGVAEDDLPTLRDWIAGANIRWGLHAAQRASLGLPADADDVARAAPARNSWAFGLRRMLLGYAVGDKSGGWRGIEPYAEVGGLDAALLGPLLRLVDALDHTWRTLREPADVATWCSRLRALTRTFFAADGVDGAADAYTLERLDSALDAWLEASNEAAFDGDVPLAVASEQWLAALEGSGLAQRFFAGAVTFATLMPMRAIPFRHVCLLGMNDGDYPRSRTPLDFDLMRADYRPGDRSRREDDRYLFLEALLSARDRLHVSWVGRSVTDNTPRPPSVLVGQLRDHLKDGWRMTGRDDDPDALLDALTVEHRLQPFSEAYFPVDPGTSKLFTYASEWNRGTVPEPADRSVALAPFDRDEPLALAELIEFVRQPVRSFFRQRLRVAFETRDEASADHEPFDVDGLQRWQLQNELIRAQDAARRQGADDLLPAARARLERLRRSGALADGGFGDVIAAELIEPLPGLFDRYRAALARWPHEIVEPFELRVETAGGPALEDWLGGLYSADDGAHARVVLDPGELVDKSRHYRGDKLIAPWIEHLAAQVACGPVTTVIVSKKGDVEFAPLEADVARARLVTLLDAWRTGMTRPLPLAAQAAFAWLRRLSGHEPDAAALEQAAKAARLVYEGSESAPGECAKSPYLSRAWPDYAALTASGEFAVLAAALLQPLVDAIGPVAGGAGAEGDLR